MQESAFWTITLIFAESHNPLKMSNLTGMLVYYNSRGVSSRLPVEISLLWHYFTSFRTTKTPTTNQKLVELLRVQTGHRILKQILEFCIQFYYCNHKDKLK